MLKVSSLAKSFSGLKAVSDASFELQAGEIVSMIGPNGAGKTSVFNMITGFYAADTGSILFKGQEINGLPPHAIARLGIGRTFQNIELFQDMTVAHNMRVACQCHSPVSALGAIFRLPSTLRREREESERIAALLELLGLADKADYLASALSYGEQRRLEMARALATDASLILLDEPTAGMTPTEVGVMMETIERVRQRGITIFLIEHNMKLVMGVSDRIIVMDHGVKIAEGKPAEIRSNPRVLQAYLGEEDAA
ncbi:ABC transporter ATP-binding protein [Ferrovibrio sp. MS7]|jgi:branched-chain amino acid transport system ATP-binding protein|uniref:ABC transporter ATP-binding protein n=1 Tax=Ferrovibrio TaxID=1231242 RepID=UPI0031359C55